MVINPVSQAPLRKPAPHSQQPLPKEPAQRDRPPHLLPRLLPHPSLPPAPPPRTSWWHLGQVSPHTLLRALRPLRSLHPCGTGGTRRNTGHLYILCRCHSIREEECGSGATRKRFAWEAAAEEAANVTSWCRHCPNHHLSDRSLRPGGACRSRTGCRGPGSARPAVARPECLKARG